MAGRVLGVLATLALAGLLWWLRPFPAEPIALEALEDGGGVDVTETRTSVTFSPDDPADVGLVLSPGARVDPRAYAALLREVAEAGYPVHLVKLPLDVAFLHPDVVEDAAEQQPDVARWVVAGHSLGGAVVADEVIRDDVGGLALWAAYPLGDLSGVAGRAVLSVSGTEDRLTTPADVEASRADLPPDATFVAVEGGVHAFFGDYGVQPGDGTPTVDRGTAQAQIVAATLALLEDVSGGAS